MSEDRYPILVPGWSDLHPADRAICVKCEFEFTWNPEEGDPYDLCAKHGNPTVPGDCGGQIVMKYDSGEQCAGCGKLAYSMPTGLDGCCSRVCMLQVEYLRQLRGAA